jgi:hypothetical protein
MSARSTRFLAAFNDIEDCLRAVLGADKHVGFAKMARAYTAEKRLPASHLDALLAFAYLRNAITHGRYYDGHPIADPVPEVVDQIERLRDQLRAPPEALTVLGVMDVCVARPDELISGVLEHVRRFDYSQLPVYDEGGYVGILTTNTIARWLGRQLTINGGRAEDEPVSRALGFAEPHERALLVGRSITAAEAIDQLSYGGQAQTPVTGLIITDNGKDSDEPLAVIVAYDLPALTAALETT